MICVCFASFRATHRVARCRSPPTSEGPNNLKLASGRWIGVWRLGLPAAVEANAMAGSACSMPWLGSAQPPTNRGETRGAVLPGQSHRVQSHRVQASRVVSLSWQGRLTEDCKGGPALGHGERRLQYVCWASGDGRGRRAIADATELTDNLQSSSAQHIIVVRIVVANGRAYSPRPSSAPRTHSPGRP